LSDLVFFKFVVVFFYVSHHCIFQQWVTVVHFIASSKCWLLWHYREASSESGSFLNNVFNFIKSVNSTFLVNQNKFNFGSVL
jgi:hypothetical protein